MQNFQRNIGDLKKPKQNLKYNFAIYNYAEQQKGIW